MPIDYLPTTLLHLYPQSALPKGIVTTTGDVPGLVLACEGDEPENTKLLLTLSNDADGFDVFRRQEYDAASVGIKDYSLTVDVTSACSINGRDETIGNVFLSGKGPGIIGAWRVGGRNMRLAFLWTGEQVGSHPPSDAVAFKRWKLIAKVDDRELVLFERA
jgi:hypothetical protein